MGKESGRHTITTEMTANELLVHIFEDILPQYEMPLRREQEEFALFILDSLLHRRLALAEAGVGTGKTHAYLIASIVYNLYTDNRLPVVIATSTVALQEAITNIYLPQLSKILTKSGVLGRRLTFTVRKGKMHYICDKRLEKYRRETNEKEGWEEGMLLKKMENAGWKEIDLDRWEVPSFVKRKVCVQYCRKDCSARNGCRYQMLLNDGRKEKYDFQIVNHGYILGDLLREKEGRISQLPEYDVLIFDEAHKLRDTARQMYGITLSERKLLNLAGHLEEGSESARRGKKRLMEKMLALFEAEEEGEINDAICNLSRELAGWQRKNVSVSGDAKKEQMIRNLCEKLLPKLLMMRKDDQILWKERAGNGDRQICSLSKKMNGTLYQDLWANRKRKVVTSGTMSVGGDFSRFKAATGIDRQPVNSRISEISKRSPFHYEENAALYLPGNLPQPRAGSRQYVREIAREVKRLTDATSGHTLVLTTSYWMLDQLLYRLTCTDTRVRFPVYAMKRGKAEVLEQFKKSGNGILLASDLAGEGIDLPGDIVSSVVIVKLPFPVPKAVTEHERKEYGSFQDFLDNVIVPEMLIKLRQWVGRAVRRETDTAVISILDSRAGTNGMYRDRILDALPPMPVIDSIEEVEHFIREKKDEEYFCG